MEMQVKINIMPPMSFIAVSDPGPGEKPNEAHSKLQYVVYGPISTTGQLLEIGQHVPINSSL
ncbi:MAG: hypothetical protein ACLFUU_13140 [Desulfobacteraceae bacterium]